MSKKDAHSRQDSNLHWLNQCGSSVKALGLVWTEGSDFGNYLAIRAGGRYRLHVGGSGADPEIQTLAGLCSAPLELVSNTQTKASNTCC